MIDSDKLLNFPIPDIYQEWRKRDTILYALSVGLGQNPVDEQQLDFVDQHRSLIAVPAMAVVLGYPGFWLGNPGTGVDRNSVLHGEQHVTILRPLPVEGRLIGRTRVTGLIDKGVGNAALLLSTKTVLDAQTEEVFAVTSSTTFVRGGGGFSGQRSTPPAVHPVPDSGPDIVVDQPTRPEQSLLYRLNGDDNDIHSSPQTAARAGFPRPILHGLCSFGIACHGLLRALGNYQAHRLKCMGLRFSVPVFPGETLRMESGRMVRSAPASLRGTCLPSTTAMWCSMRPESAELERRIQRSTRSIVSRPKHGFSKKHTRSKKKVSHASAR